MLWNTPILTGVLLFALLIGLVGCAGNRPPPADASPESAHTASSASPATSSSASPATSSSASPTTSIAPPAPTGAPSVEDYRIGSQDLLELQVFGIDALNRTVRVNSRGFISLPLVGLVQAAGLTSEQLEEALAAKLAQDYLQNPQVSVFIKEFTSQRVTVEGAVKKPGVYPLKGRTSLLQTLATAEGLSSVADTTVRIFRTDSATSNRVALEFDLEQIRAGETPDPVVQNDDIVQVRESQGKAVAKELIEFILPFGVLGL